VKNKSPFAVTFLLLFLISAAARSATYYVSPGGNDANDGLSTTTAWQTIGKVNSVNFSAGDRILFEAGSTFTGSLSFDNNDAGTEGNPIILSSYGSGRAVVNAGTQNGFYAYNTGGIELKKIRFMGDGSYPTGQRGIYFYTDLTSGQRLKHIYIDECEVSGFSSGIIVSAYKFSTIGFEDIKITNCSSHDNLFTGIGVSGWVGSAQNRAHKNLYIADCVAYNISGGVNNTGNGISIADCENGIIEYCEAYNNGYGNTGTSGGPEGIIAYRTDGITIQYSISHNNKTGPNNWDGGGFDLDGGTTNCILQYNYAYENEGQGFFMGHFGGATPKINNIVRYNISENNGLRHGYGGIGFWGQSGNTETGLKIYNNVIYTGQSKVIDGSPSCMRLENAAATTYTDIVIYNNIFITADGLNLINIPSQTNKFTFKNNLYYSSGGVFNIRWGGATYNSLSAWRTATGQEKLNANDVGIQADPKLINAGNGEKALTPRTMASLMNAYKLQSNSPCKDSGLDLNALFGINPGNRDFYGSSIPQNGSYDIGAHEYISSPVQSISLTSGWNWISFNRLPADLSLNSVFKDILSQVEQVKAQTQSVIRSSNNWKGDLADMSGIGQYKMYKVKVNAACTLTVTGTAIAPTTQIALVSGWNWVAYLPTTAMPIATALASINGHVQEVKSLTQSATYNGTTWSGTLTQLEPGKGYAIRVSGAINLIYPEG
jgi:hypothetical protein